MAKKPYELTGKELLAYRRGFLDGQGKSYFPCLSGKELVAYDRGYRDALKLAGAEA
jgi:hypothetical protein